MCFDVKYPFHQGMRIMYGEADNGCPMSNQMLLGLGFPPLAVIQSSGCQ